MDTSQSKMYAARMTRIPWPAWDQAGVANLERQAVGSSAPDVSWLAPTDLEIADGSIVAAATTPWRSVESGRGIFTAFLRLGDAPGEQLLLYALKWGLLGLCDHGLPQTHALATSAAGMDFGYSDRPPACPAAYARPVRWPSEPTGRSERLEWWRKIARDAYAAVDIAARLHKGQPAPAERWASLAWAPSRTEMVEIVRSLTLYDGAQAVGFQKSALAQLANEWLAVGDVRPVIRWWGAGTPAINLRNRGLFGALAIQLALTVSKATGLAGCDGCGRPLLDGTIRTDRRNYCGDCKGKNESRKAAARDYRQSEKYRQWREARKRTKREGTDA